MPAVAFPPVAIIDSTETGRSILTAADVAAVLAILGISGGGGGGSTWYIGSGTPSAGLGVNGDAYLNVANGDVYSKAAGAWGTPAGNIRGPQGATGATGATGAQGPQGATGPQGIQGPQGDPGPTGATGPQGIQGLKGDTGDTGPQGPQGDPGPTGATGATGPAGDTGPAGADGATWHTGSGAPSAGTGVNGDLYLDTAASDVYRKAAGSWSVIANIKGATGATGAAGSNGATGAAGADGKTVRSGSGAPSGGLGVDGDFYIDTTAHAIYGPKTGGSWGSSTSLVGPTGATGATGPAGATGATGPQGPTGSLTMTSLKTANYTAVAGEWVRFDLSGASADVTLTLPATPSANDRVTVTLATKHATYKLVVARNGSNVNGSTVMTSFNMTADGATCVFTYVGGNAGWIGAVAV